MIGGRTKSKQTGHSNRDTRSDPVAGTPTQEVDCPPTDPVPDIPRPESIGLGETARLDVGAIRFVCLGIPPGPEPEDGPLFGLLLDPLPPVPPPAPELGAEQSIEWSLESILTILVPRLGYDSLCYGLVGYGLLNGLVGYDSLGYGLVGYGLLGYDQSRVVEIIVQVIS